jgi:hypothetical protein
VRAFAGDSTMTSEVVPGGAGGSSSSGGLREDARFRFPIPFLPVGIRFLAVLSDLVGIVP